MVESLLGVDPTQSYGENTKSRNQEFIDFAIKTYWKMIGNINLWWNSHNYLLFSHIFVWFYYIFKSFNWNSENKF